MIFGPTERTDPAMASACATALRPPEDMLPSEFAERYRYLKQGTTERPGLWSNDVFPYLVGIMDAGAEAIRTGKRGLVVMKSGQGGGSEAIINLLMWLLYQYPGPMLYLISKDDLAREFSRERFSYINKTCEPIRRKVLTGRGSGELIQVKRYVDAKLAILGGRSVLNMQSLPYRVVIVDEHDSLQEEIAGSGDLMKIIEIRVDAFTGPTLIVSFAHPTIKDRGVGRLYEESSDQRRGHVVCPHCDEEFWLQWEHVKAIPLEKETQSQADRIAARYRYFAPCCGAEISDAQRFQMCRNVKQKSLLSKEDAESKSWIGVHFSQLYMSNKTLAFLAREYIDGLGDEAVMRVFFNKRLGEVYNPVVTETTQDSWRSLIVIRRSEDDLEAYRLGQVPPGVQMLTAGQDSSSTELHYSVWGWGYVRNTAGEIELCGWLIDYGVYVRDPKSYTLEAVNLAVFDQSLYRKTFPRTNGEGYLTLWQGYHDAGWQPIGPMQYARRWRGRAVPCKGDARTDSDMTKSPPVRMGSPISWKIGDQVFEDKSIRLAVLNTYLLKLQLFGLVGRRVEVPGQPLPEIRTRLNLPLDLGDDWIKQSASEYLTSNKKQRIWKSRGPNHYSDTNVYAFAAAVQNDFMLDGLFKQEDERARKSGKRPPTLRGKQTKRIRTKY